MEKSYSHLCLFISPQERLQLFDTLCEHYGKLSTPRIVERVGRDLNIRRPNVYRYMKTNRRRSIPNELTTSKIVSLLMDYGLGQSILPLLKQGSDRMSTVAKAYREWIRNREVVNSPFSRAEVERLERSMMPNLLVDKKRVRIR